MSRRRTPLPPRSFHHLCQSLSSNSAEPVVVRGMRAEVRDRADLLLPRDEDVGMVAVFADVHLVATAAGMDLLTFARRGLLRRHPGMGAAFGLPAARLRPE